MKQLNVKDKMTATTGEEEPEKKRNSKESDKKNRKESCENYLFAGFNSCAQINVAEWTGTNFST